LEDGDDVGGDGVFLGRYGLAIRVEQAIVRAEEGLRDYAACDPAFVSLVRVGRVRKAKGRQRTYRIQRRRFPVPCSFQTTNATKYTRMFCDLSTLCRVPSCLPCR
jgi:hypothetical protein